MTAGDDQGPDRTLSSATIHFAIRFGFIALLGYWSFRVIAPFLTIGLWTHPMRYYSPPTDSGRSDRERAEAGADGARAHHANAGGHHWRHRRQDSVGPQAVSVMSAKPR